MKKIILLLATTLISTAHIHAQKLTVHTIGDSTMADYVENTTRTRGWGEMLQEFFTSDVRIINYARGGRSSRSFTEEGLWDKVKSNLNPGDYVFIQFAHNDEKEQGKDGADGRGTAPWTTYKTFLEQYVDETEALGANPVFITPIVRRYFTKVGTISPKGCHDIGIAPDDSTLNYVRVMKHVAREKQVPLIDMTTLTKNFAEQLGEETTIKCIYVPTDGTHTQATGAACYAALVAQELKQQGILSDYIQEDAPLILNPTSLDFQTIYIGDKATLCFDLTGLKLIPSSGILRLEAPQGMTLSDAPQSSPKTVIELPYSNGKLWNQCFYLHFSPKHTEKVSTVIPITYGSNKRFLPVTAISKKISHQSPVIRECPDIAVKSLIQTEKDITIETGKWPADIDEDGKRYAEVIIQSNEKSLIIRRISFTLEGEISYRLAYAHGKDFYPRTDLAEQPHAPKAPGKQIFPVNVTLKPHERLHIRLFPWSTRQSKELYFRIKDCRFEGMEIE